MTRHVRARCAGALVLSFVLFTNACAGNGDGSRDEAREQVLAPSGSADGFVVTFGTEPAPPSTGDNQVAVTVKRPDGTAVTDATVTIVFSMAAMPSMNMPAMHTEASLAHAGDGTYRGGAQFAMGGTWDVAMSLRRSASEAASRRTSVVVKD